MVGLQALFLVMDKAWYYSVLSLGPRVSNIPSMYHRMAIIERVKVSEHLSMLMLF
jgi:hypothetical protein